MLHLLLDGMCSTSKINVFKTLAEKGINIKDISTSEVKISVLIDQDYVELAQRLYTKL